MTIRFCTCCGRGGDAVAEIAEGAEFGVFVQIEVGDAEVWVDQPWCGSMMVGEGVPDVHGSVVGQDGR